MAKYIQRPAELRDRLKLLYPTSDRTSQKLDEMIVKWAEKREKLLEDLTIQVRWTYPQAQALGENWAKTIKAARVELNYLFGESTKDLMLPPAAQLWWYQAYREENDFLAQLEGLFVPKFVMDLHRYLNDLQTLITELDQKWSGLIGAKGPIDTAEKEAIAAAERVLAEVLNAYESRLLNAMDEVLKAKEKLVDWSARMGAKIEQNRAAQLAATGAKAGWEGIKKGIEILTGVEFPQEAENAAKTGAVALDHATRQLQVANAAYLERVAVYRYTLAREGSVLQMFKANREQVQLYLRNNNIELARQWRSAAAEFIRKWADGRATPQMKADATLFANEIVVAVDEIGQRADALDRNFQDKFAGMFVGPLSGICLEAITQEAAQKVYIDRIKALGGDAKLANPARQLSAAMDAQIEKAVTAVALPDPEAQAALREEMALKKEEIRKILRRTLDERIQGLITASLTLSEAVTPDKIQASFTKTDVVYELKR